ncbi:MAG: ribonuclease P [Candidatus Aenigmarchaeota archaeon ex4484_224]|nr:MAG: ribonuclease P [Candidatus Aenigmarchaeota archaeon ex4484_224]
MPITPKNLVRHELIGLKVFVKKCKNKLQEKIRGKVVDETYNMLIIEDERDGREKKIAKKDCIFIFVLPDGTKVEVDGKILVGRPEDRIKKKFPKW